MLQRTLQVVLGALQKYLLDAVPANTRAPNLERQTLQTRVRSPGQPMPNQTLNPPAPFQCRWESSRRGGENFTLTAAGIARQ